MGAAAAPLAIGASIASAGFGAMSSVASGAGAQAQANLKAAESEFQAQRAERAAMFGRIQADQTDVSLREELNTTLANIDAIRGASGIDPSSPTGAAIRDREEEVSDRQRRSKVASLLMQAEEDDRSAVFGRSTAMYMRQVGDMAFQAGKIGAAAKLLGGIAGGFRGG